MIKLLATDLDGTLLDANGKVSRQNIDAIAAINKMGIPTIAATARSPRSASKISKTAGLGPYAICANGAIVYDLQSKTLLRHDPISQKVSKSIISILRDEFEAVILAGEYVDDFFAEANFFKRPIPDLIIPTTKDLLTKVDQGMTKVIGRVPGKSSEELRDHLAPMLSQFVDVTISGPDWIEFAAHGITKAHGVTIVCEIIGISPSQVAAIGDQRNDLDMLNLVGYPFTLQSAHPDLFSITDRVVPHHDDSGFSQLALEIEKIIAQN
ncbi:MULTISPECIES: Cof-type HAD-IIB family hydrolase [Acidithrix]|uniref:Pyridoxal phosphate phosphatase YigL n=1 Tax=Acidithrix ferrooxidans TaxID=1280514 RepID=A0A0D8HJR3_9ACTN|nr:MULTISPECIES: Cof-type HAD-IIB family hydrolase [Acidithrix]KJF18190.1 pyridoxal phosphate phosphatase YigL [Acidithrix ferrooxidans]CAG4899965.1 unnamed protein product [Acidithrix sp. C25]